jgi:hypothetical protein
MQQLSSRQVHASFCPIDCAPAPCGDQHAGLLPPPQGQHVSRGNVVGNAGGRIYPSEDSGTMAMFVVRDSAGGKQEGQGGVEGFGEAAAAEEDGRAADPRTSCK